MKDLSLYSNKESKNSANRYEGLEAMRVVSSFAVVFFHVCGTFDVPENLIWLVKFRDFALPVMVTSSFFVLTVSLDRKPQHFRTFFDLRLIRLFIPLLIWTSVYTAFYLSLVAFTSGLDSVAGVFSPVVFLTGYRHLWYLQFIFIGSIIFYPIVVRLLNSYKISRTKLSLVCIAAAGFYQVLYHIWFRDLIWENMSADMDINLQIFIDQTSRYLFYIPLGIGLGLLCKHINSIFENAFFRKISLVLVIIGILLHTKFFVPFSQEIYGLAVFLAALQPWKKIPSDLWKKFVAHSYGIYILHFFLVQLLWLFTVNFSFEINAAKMVFAALIIYLLSFSCAVLITKFFPFEWLLPLIKIKRVKYSNN